MVGPKISQIGKTPGILRVYLESPGYTWKIPCDRLGIVPISSILRQILPQTSSQTQGNSRVSRMEHQTPSVFRGNFRKRKVLGTLCFPFCLPEKLVQANLSSAITRSKWMAPLPHFSCCTAGAYNPRLLPRGGWLEGDKLHSTNGDEGVDGAKKTKALKEKKRHTARRGVPSGCASGF